MAYSKKEVISEDDFIRYAKIAKNIPCSGFYNINNDGSCSTVRGIGTASGEVNGKHFCIVYTAFDNKSNGDTISEEVAKYVEDTKLENDYVAICSNGLCLFIKMAMIACDVKSKNVEIVYRHKMLGLWINL